MLIERADLHRLRALLKEVIGSLRVLSSALSEAAKATIETISKNTEAAQKASEQQPIAQPSRITVDVQIPREGTDRYYTEQRRGYRLQWWTLWATIATFVAVSIYAIVTWLQWRTMDATFVEIRKQTYYAGQTAEGATNAAGIAQHALEQTRDLFRQDQRPYIWLTSIAGPHFVPSGQVVWDWKVH